MREFIERFICMLSAFGLIALLASSSVWGPTVDNWPNEGVQVVQVSRCL